VVLGNWLRTNVPGLVWYAKNSAGASAPILGGLASFIAMFNSFVWNRAWTFEQRGKEERLSHLRRFYTVSILGALWNALIFSVFYNLIPGHSIFIPKVLGAFIVAIWNFLGQRYYAFRPRK
jgi:putative flippase GtrA